MGCPCRKGHSASARPTHVPSCVTNAGSGRQLLHTHLPEAVTDVLLTSTAVERPRGRVGERPPRSSSASSFRGFGFRIGWERFVQVSGAGLTDRKPRRLSLSFRRRAPSHLWLGRRYRNRFSSTSGAIPTHSRGTEFHALGLQSYSRRLCLSRGKHYRLYP